MSKRLAQEGQRSSRSAPSNNPGLARDGKSTRGARPAHISVHDRHLESEETTARRRHSRDISQEAIRVNPSQSLHSKDITSDAPKSLVLPEKDASMQRKGRNVTALETTLANSPDDRTRRDQAPDPNCDVSDPSPREHGHIDQTPAYVNHGPVSVDSRPGTRRKANGAHGLSTDQLSTNMTAQPTAQSPPGDDDLHQAESALGISEAFESLPEPLAGFVADVADGNGKRCARFLHERPDAVNKPLVASILRQAAVIGMKSGNEFLAENCVKALGIISFCLSSSRVQRTKLFTTMILRGEDEATHKLRQLVHEERRLCAVLSATYHTADQQASLTHLRNLFQENRTGKKRKDKKTDNERLQNLLQVPPLMEEQHLIGEMFQKKGSQFFRPGSMFKTIEYEVILTGPTGSKAPEKSRPEVVRNILYYVCVKVGENYCLALQAKTYGGLGLSMPSHVSASVESHAVIYNTEPQLLPDEPDKLKEQAIKVCLATGVHDLHPAMRLDLGRVYTVEYSVRAQEVGEVEKPTQLVAEWKKQMVGEW